MDIEYGYYTAQQPGEYAIKIDNLENMQKYAIKNFIPRIFDACKTNL